MSDLDVNKFIEKLNNRENAREIVYGIYSKGYEDGCSHKQRLKNRQYAFWKYDQPPYVLCGEVLEVREDGGVYVKGYDQQMTSYFTKEAIIAIVPYKKGLKLEKQLNKAKKKYEQKLKRAKTNLLTMRDIIAEEGNN